LRYPISVGIGPEKNEFKIINSSKFVRLLIQEFVVREKSPCERVKKIKLLRSPIHEKNDSFAARQIERGPTFPKSQEYSMRKKIPLKLVQHQSLETART
jgi:hypothetical protein